MSSLRVVRVLVAFLFLFALKVGFVASQERPDGVPFQPDWKPGPQKVMLGDDLAKIDVPEGYLYADSKGAQDILRAMGNPPSGRELGLITPAADDKTWFLILEWNDVGYVKDEDQDEIDADAILASIKEGTEAANEERKKMGASAMHVVGWFEKPHYDPKTHNLVWAIEGKDETESHSVNYDIRFLGRKGYTSATLVTDPAALAADRVEVERLLSGFSYNTGNRYAEFVKGDKVAEYGLAALVAGGAGAAALKLGLFGKLGKLLAGFWKLIVVGVVGLGAWLKKLFSARKQDMETPIQP
jgi:uncharacterized membrane-anchored protein